MKPRVSIVVPAYNEGQAIEPFLSRVLESVEMSCELLIVVDSLEDTTVPYVEKYSRTDNRARTVLNSIARGPAYAIRCGIAEAVADVVVVTMADGSDDPRQIDHLARLVERGVVVAAASRYSRGGQQVGGQMIKRTLSRLAGLSLAWLGRVGTHDATNSFKAYDAQFVRDVGIDSDAGFEIGIELVAKARRARLPVAELPTIWLERHEGMSNFKLVSWLPRYLRWWFFSFGPRLTIEEVRRASAPKACS